MFIKEVGVQGYQSLYKVGLKLGQFTVIFGESDVGKSALYRAIRALLTAESGDSFISKGVMTPKIIVETLGKDNINSIIKKAESENSNQSRSLAKRLMKEL